MDTKVSFCDGVVYRLYLCSSLPSSVYQGTSHVKYLDLEVHINVSVGALTLTSLVSPEIHMQMYQSL